MLKDFFKNLIEFLASATAGLQQDSKTGADVT